jgi:hypothetical protein
METQPAGQAVATRPGWSTLSTSARAVRLVHISIAVVGLSSLVYVWMCALTGHRDQVLVAALAALLLQGTAIVIGRGNCPLGPLQQRLGDPTPLFALVLPPRAAKAAFPLLITVTLAGIALLAVRYVA